MICLQNCLGVDAKTTFIVPTCMNANPTAIKTRTTTIEYHSILMSYYGFDVKSGKWNTRSFLITQSDTQLEGIQLDIERYSDAVRNYNKYAEHLAKEFCIDIEDEMKKGHLVVFHPPSPHSSV